MEINSAAQRAGFHIVPGGDGEEGGAGEEGIPRAAEALAEAAARHVFPRGGHIARYDGQGGFARQLGAGYGGEQCARVRVAGVGKELLHRGALHHAPGVHNPHDVAVLRDDAEVVCDEQRGRPELTAQLSQQGEHLVLHGDIQRGGGLVCYDELRSAS